MKTSLIPRFFVIIFGIMMMCIVSTERLSAQSCTCKGSINASLGNDGTAIITASMLLADGSTCTGPQTVAVMLTPTGNPIPTSPVVDCSHLGKVLYGKVTNGSNSCWTSIYVMDEMPPQIVCPTSVIEVSCSGASAGIPPVVENCTYYTLDTLSRITTENNPCGVDDLPNNVLKREVIRLQATDGSGNKSNICEYTVHHLAANFDDIVFPLPYDVAPGNNDPLVCNQSFAKLPNGNPSPLKIGNLDGTGAPTLNGTIILGQGLDFCNLIVNYTDSPILELPSKCTKKLIRTWNITEWSCRTPPMTRVFTQMIEIVDNEGPSISGLSDLYATTTALKCEGRVVFPEPTLSDNCDPLNKLQVDITVYPNGDLDNPGLFIPHGSSKTRLLPVGNHVVKYTAKDGCHNFTDVFINLEIEDNTPPNAICNEHTTVGLTSTGTASISASVINDGSFDECELALLLVKRMEPTVCGACETPEIPDFDYLGTTGSGGNTSYYFASRHPLNPKQAFKKAKALGGYAVSYETSDERNFVNNLVKTRYGNNTDFIVGYSDRQVEGTFAWESGATNAMTVLDNNADKDYVLVSNSANEGALLAIDNSNQYRLVVELKGLCHFSSHVDICCSDILDNPMVILRAVDKSGNFNDCMVSLRVQDKIGPRITCPADEEKPCDFPYDLNNLAKDFGSPIVVDNCEIINDIEEDVVVNINSCRIGTITRTFTVTDMGNRTATCTQVIRFQPSESQIYNGPTDLEWPQDKTISGCGDPNDAALSPNELGRPILNDGACSLVGAQYEDQVFQFNNVGSPACFKILRKWTVIDWCQPLSTGYRTWTRTQEIKVIDNIAPVFDDLEPSVSADTYDAECANGFISLTASATDVCTNVLKNSYRIDVDNNGVFGARVNGNGNSINASGSYPVGTHRIEYTFEDKCGNITTQEQLFSIVNKKTPTPIVIRGLAINLVDMGGGIRMSEIWATDFDKDRKSVHPCYNELIYSFTPVTRNSSGGLEYTPNWVFDCSHVGLQDIQIWVAAISNTGDILQASVNTTIDVQDNNGICDQNRVVVSGTIATEMNVTLEDAKVDLIGGELFTMTDQLGSFRFPEMIKGGSYVVLPTKNDDHTNGISTLDLILIQRHILGIEKLTSPYKVIGADVNKDGRVAASDLAELRKLILGTTTQITNNTSWRFIDKNYIFNDVQYANQEAFPETYNIDQLNANMKTDFIAVKVGDVSGNAIANAQNIVVEPRSASEFIVYTDERELVSGRELVVPIKVSQRNLLTGMQMSIVFDNNAMSLTGIDQVNLKITDSNFGWSQHQNGVLTFSWNDANIRVLEDDAILFNLVFKAQVNGNLSEVLSINADQIAAEAYDQDLNIIPIGWKVENRLVAGNGFALYQNMPNPFKENTTIGFDLPEQLKVTLQIHDITGKVVLQQNAEGQQGHNTIVIHTTDLPKGVLYYTLKAGQYIETRKMVSIE